MDGWRHRRTSDDERAMDSCPPPQCKAEEEPGVPLGFQSILDVVLSGQALPSAEPAFASDLNIDQIVAAITRSYDDYDLVHCFYRPLSDAGQVAYRHAVMHDLDLPQIRTCIVAFSAFMQKTRKKLLAIEKMYYPLQKQRCLLEAANAYAECILRFTSELARLPCHSVGLTALSDYLARYIASDGFVALAAETGGLLTDLGRIRYAFHIRGDLVRVQDYTDEADYSQEINSVFERFRQDTAKDYLVKFADDTNMNHIEARVLDGVAFLHPQIFARLRDLAARYQDFVDPTIDRFDREVQFYLAYQDYIAPLRWAGLPFCYPEVSASDKESSCRDAFDLALAAKLTAHGTPVVTNDFALAGEERIIVISGPNQGGKTTFVRMVGQLHWLAALGLPVPGHIARLFLCDHIYTHFEREENVSSFRGKLQDDLLRIHAVLERMTPNSLILMNEIFSSTTLEDAESLATKVMRRIIDSDCLCVCVTFMDELASLHRKIVSMVSTVIPEDPSRRTLKVVRRPADGRAYAATIAEKYRLTDEWLQRRLER